MSMFSRTSGQLRRRHNKVEREINDLREKRDSLQDRVAAKEKELYEIRKLQAEEAASMEEFAEGS